MSEYVKWDFYLTKCGRGRITYHPDWSPSMPWASYWRGTAGLHFRTVEAASTYFRERHNAVLIVT